MYDEPPPGSCWVIAEKGHGTMLLPSKFVIDQEHKLMESMDATIVKSTSRELLTNLYEKEFLFRCNLDEQEKEFLTPFKPLHLEQTELPFLKIQGKIHKLSQEDIVTKKYSSLTFCPVCDSKFFITKLLA